MATQRNRRSRRKIKRNPDEDARRQTPGKMIQAWMRECLSYRSARFDTIASSRESISKPAD
jgi:hypothetical protein